MLGMRNACLGMRAARLLSHWQAGPEWSWTGMLVLDQDAGPGPGCWSWTRMLARLPASGSAQPEGTCPPSPASPELPWPWSQRGHGEQNQRENTKLSQSGSHFSGKNGLRWPPCCRHEQSRELRNTPWQPEAELALLNYGFFWETKAPRPYLGHTCQCSSLEHRAMLCSQRKQVMYL